MLDRIKAGHNLDAKRLIVSMRDRQVQPDVAPHILVWAKTGRTDGTWSQTDVEWDAENSQYICPEGEPLKQFRRN